MLDDSIPLTTGEYDEWGNPNDEAYYHYIKSYSPYDNVEAKDYPHLMITTGLHDSQVQILGAGQVDCQTARHENRQQCAHYVLQHGSRARRCKWAI